MPLTVKEGQVSPSTGFIQASHKTGFGPNRRAERRMVEGSK